MKDKKIIGIKLVQNIEIDPIDESEFENIADSLMNKVVDNIFEMDYFCGSAEAIPIFEK